MLPSAWIKIKYYLIEEKKNKKLVMYHATDVIVPTVNRGVFVTPDKRIQLATVEHQTEAHHNFERTIAYTRKQITVLQCVFRIFFGIGAHIR
jgi:hypothetical protein